MGVDLRLLPLIQNEYWAAHDMLGLERRRELWEHVSDLPSAEIPEPLWCFLSTDPKTGESCYGKETEDPYGQKLRWVAAGELAKLKDYGEVQDNWRNKAIWAYLAEMPVDWKIVLYWR